MYSVAVCMCTGMCTYVCMYVCRGGQWTVCVRVRVMVVVVVVETRFTLIHECFTQTNFKS